MRSKDQKSTSIDELGQLHEDVILEFDRKLWLEEIDLEERLRDLQGADNVSAPLGPRRLDA